MEEKIEEVLRHGPRTNRELRSDLGLKTKTFDAKLDRTLQRMRKDGKIKADKGRWFVASLITCPACKGRGWVNK